MKNLAIKGHETRGKEVIEIFEMMGGENYWGFTGNDTDLDYYIETDRINICYENKDILKFTLEEFLEKYPYKVGDKVQDLKSGEVFTISRLCWNNKDCTVYYFNPDIIQYYNVEDLKLYKENNEMSNNITLTHSDKKEKKSLLTSLIEYFQTTPKEELEREWNEHKELDEIGPTVEEYMKDNNTSSTMRVLPLKSEYCSWERILYPIPDGYEFSKIENNEIVIQKKQPKYPKTYKECCKVLGYQLLIKPINILAYNNTSLSFFHKLIFCRNTYWEIAGKEMGLGKTWKPKSDNEELYYIQNCNGRIVKGLTNTTFDKNLFFPTEEMRDVFYENFKDLIEACKELL